MLRLSLPIVLLLTPLALGEEHTFKINVEAGKVARKNSPVAVPVSLPAGIDRAQPVRLEGADGNSLVGQLAAASIAAGDPNRKSDIWLHFILPELAAGESAQFTVTIGGAVKRSPLSFAWVDTSKPKGPGDDYAEQSCELRLADRPVMRYMHSALDESSKEARAATYKPYHHVYDPQGKRFVTKGPGGLFPHHRGLYFGFNKITYGPDGKKQADTWHCNNGEYQAHVEFLSEEAGPVLGRHVVRIDWHGRDGKVFAVEKREMTAYNTPEAVTIEFASLLANDSEHRVRLDGDPQHAGFQFRASQDVPDKTAKETYYVRPDGKGEPGKFRNWPADKQHVNLPWHALCFVLDDQRYTCCYLDHPQNPKESRFSERDYGRFGSYFEYDLERDRPLRLNYRIHLQAGEMTVDQVQRLDDDFVQPLAVAVR